MYSVPLPLVHVVLHAIVHVWHPMHLLMSKTALTWRFGRDSAYSYAIERFSCQLKTSGIVTHLRSRRGGTASSRRSRTSGGSPPPRGSPACIPTTLRPPPSLSPRRTPSGRPSPRARRGRSPSR